MSGMLKKVQSGSPFRPRAGDWNAFVDAARNFEERQRSRSRPELRENALPSGVVFVRNSTGADQDRFAILGMDEPVISPTDHLDRFRNRIAFDGVSPSGDAHAARYVVLREPLKAGSIGRGWADGVCPVRINVTDEHHGFAVPVDGNTANLESAARGAAQTLWKEAGTGEKWAVVRLGVPAGLPPIYKATADQSGNTVLAKLLLADGSLATGNAEELDVYSDAWKVRADDLLILTQDADGLPVAMPIQGCDNAFTVPAGSGDTADTTTWNINSQPSGYGGVRVEKWFRLYWSGTSGDPVYQFSREAKYDSKGALLYVGPEVRSVAFGTDTCE